MKTSHKMVAIPVDAVRHTSDSIYTGMCADTLSDMVVLNLTVCDEKKKKSERALLFQRLLL